MVRATGILVSIKSSLGNAQNMLSRNLICRPYTNSLFSHSGDGTTFTTVALGTWVDDDTLKTTVFTPTAAQYMRIVALSEAGGRGPWSSCAEINIYTATDPPADAATLGVWGPTIEFPLVPVSAAIEWSTGNLLVWSSYEPTTFGGTNMVQTYTATYDLASGTVTEALITNTDHDMFCEGLSMDFTGRIFATGGNTDDATSYYDSPSNSWAKAAVSTPPRVSQEDSSTDQSRGSLCIQLTPSPDNADSPWLPSPSHHLHGRHFRHRCLLVWRPRRQKRRNLQRCRQHLDTPSRLSCSSYAHCRCTRYLPSR